MYKLTLDQIYQIWKLGFEEGTRAEFFGTEDADSPHAFADSLKEEDLPLSFRMLVEFANQKSNEFSKN